MKFSRKVHFLITQESNQHEKYTLNSKTKRILILPFSNYHAQKRQHDVREAVKRAIALRRNL